ncbi:DUF2931 family protein [Pseudomonas sp. 681]|uniref:DUF2931 family protein n=1 Tax=Pseudomonas fungipugnans TaxID=3024217 RepID=A0ABT6QU11_9PSED|nr:DUF2931 family protein [Pseudomonas sp. 681]MDI2594354.1 DUF2931 family protein [Pseudomonas sp. 681]
MRALWILWGASLLIGCQVSGLSWGRSDPDSGPWAIGFTQPYFMEVWVEDSAMVDVDGVLYRHIGSGGAAGGEKKGADVARGWGKKGGGGSEKDVKDAKLPVRIYARWQSIVEPQTYQGWIEVPESARQVMRDALTKNCPTAPEANALPKIASVRLGLAPGGIVQIWVLNECMRPVKVANGKVDKEPLGPYLGKSGGRYYPQTDASKQYVEKYGIPYGSW